MSDTPEPDGGNPETATSDRLNLTYPSEDPLGFLRNHFGPSALWALTGIGTSHLILAPTIGARYGLFAVWIVGFVYLIKWGGWELGVRYTYATGRNPVEGYADLPGPARWGQWFTFAVFFGIWTVIFGAVTGGTASFMSAVLPTVAGYEVGFFGWYVALTAVVSSLVYFVWYDTLENVLKLFVGALGVLVVLGVFVAPPSPEVVEETLFAVPDVTDPVFVALFVGAGVYIPIGLSSTVSIGSWSTAKKQGARRLREEDVDPDDPEYRDYVESWVRTGLRDYNLSFVFSLAVVVSMVALASSTLWVSGEVPSGQDVPFTVASVLESSYGAWAFYALFVGAVAALVSTMICTIDSVSRVCSDVLVAVSEEGRDGERLRRLFVVFVALAGIAPVLVIGNVPVTLITFSAALAAIFQVFFYIANYYIVRKHLPKELQPSEARKVYYFSTVVLVAILGFLGALNNFGLVGA